MNNLNQQQQRMFYSFSTPAPSSYYYYYTQQQQSFNLIDTSFVQLNNQFKMTPSIPSSSKILRNNTQQPYLMRRVDHKQQQQQQQTKNYIQKLYEIKSLNPIEFDTIQQIGPAHKPQFQMKLTVNKSLKNEKIFTSKGVSKKQAKLNASKECLLWITELVEIERIKYLNEIEVIEIKSLFLQECNDSLQSTPNVQPQPPQEEVKQQQFINDNLLINTNLFTNFISTATTSSPTTITTNKKIINSSLTNPISIFTELIPSDAYSFTIVDEWGSSHAKQFKIQLIVKLKLIKIPIEQSSIKQQQQQQKGVNEEEEKSYYAIGNSKKQAKMRVTQLALESLFNIKVNTQTNNNNNNNIVDDAKFHAFANGISDLIKEKYVELMQKNNALESNDSKLRTVYASVIQTSDADLSLDKSKIIVITSGTKCINGEFMSLNGSTINDSHAEIIACRLLKKYLYETLNVYIDYLTKKQTVEEIDENYIWELINNDDCDDDDDEEDEGDEEENKNYNNKCFRLKENIKFHLFISTTPCGDGRIFAVHDNHDGIDNHPNRKIRGLLRAKLESGEGKNLNPPKYGIFTVHLIGTIPVGGNFKLQTWDAILTGDRLKVMSCSDKLCKLNVVGVQGALLSHFIETIYFESVIIGSFYHYDHLSR